MGGVAVGGRGARIGPGDRTAEECAEKFAVEQEGRRPEKAGKTCPYMPVEPWRSTESVDARKGGNASGCKEKRNSERSGKDAAWKQASAKLGNGGGDERRGQSRRKYRHGL